MAKIGLDFGGVLQCAKGDDTNADVSELPLMEGAMDGVKRLVEKFGSDNVFIVSKAGKSVAAGTLSVLEKEDFYDSTGFLRENVHFTTKRNGSWGKWPVIQKLGINVFVDDNWSLFCDPLVEELCRGEKITAVFFDYAASAKASGDAFGADAPSSDAAAGSREVVASGAAIRDDVSGANPDAVARTTVELDRDSNDKKANRNEKAPFACGKEAYYRKYSYADLEQMWETEKGRSLVRLTGNKMWTDLVDLLFRSGDEHPAPQLSTQCSDS